MLEKARNEYIFNQNRQLFFIYPYRMYCNWIVEAKMMERRRKQYEERLKNMKGTKHSQNKGSLDTGPPHTPDFLHKNHKKEQARRGTIILLF